MKITLRERKRKNKITLYLDIYHKGKRKTETLDMFLYPESPSGKLTKEQKKHNKEQKIIAQLVRDKRSLEYQSKFYGLEDISKMSSSFIEYFRIQMRQRRNSDGNYGSWDGALKHLLKFTKGEDVLFRDIDVSWILKVRNYFEHEASTKGGKKLAQNSKYSYFAKIKAALKQATKEGILRVNPGEKIDNIKQGETHREYLTEEELKEIIKYECDYPILKRAFLFGCFTGLRFGDIQKLKWSEIQKDNGGKTVIRFTQQKTKGNETHPINNVARHFLEERKNSTDKVFKGLQYSSWHNQKLREWIRKASILKHITFHSSRHTYATLLLAKGAEVATVSKMLGHKELKTTMIYAKVIDKKKREASELINFDPKDFTDEN